MPSIGSQLEVNVSSGDHRQNPEVLSAGFTDRGRKQTLMNVTSGTCKLRHAACLFHFNMERFFISGLCLISEY